MRVVHLCQDRPERVGGSSVVAQELVRAQNRLGIDSTLVLLYTPKEVAKHVDGHACAIRYRSRWTAGIAELRRALRSLNPDIVHHHHGLAWPWMAAVSRSRVHVTHGHLSAPSRGLFSGPGLCSTLTRRFSSRVIAISQPVADSWRGAGISARNVVLIPNGVDCERFRPAPFHEVIGLRRRLNLPMHRSILLWIGRLDKETKGVDRLCEIVRLIDNKYYVVVVGDGPAREYLREQLVTIGAESRVRYVGSVNDPAPYYQSADAFLFTSRREPMGLVILEAAATGLPIFAFPCEGGGKELLREVKAISVESDDPSLLAGLVNKGPLVRPSREDILTITTKYSWEACAQRSISVYAHLLDERN